MGFFDKLNNMDKRPQAALQKQINQRLDYVNQKYTEIGRYVKINMSEQITDPHIQSLLGEINRTLEELKGLNDQLNALNGIKICPSCGSSIPVNNTFCPNCGTKQPVQQVQPQQPEHHAQQMEHSQINHQAQQMQQPDVNNVPPVPPVVTPVQTVQPAQPVQPETAQKPEIKEENTQPDKFSDETTSARESVVNNTATEENSEKTPAQENVQPENNIPQQNTAESGNFIFCSQCGSKEPADMKFCSQCGNILKD